MNRELTYRQAKPDATLQSRDGPACGVEGVRLRNGLGRHHANAPKFEPVSDSDMKIVEANLADLSGISAKYKSIVTRIEDKASAILRFENLKDAIDAIDFTHSVTPEAKRHECKLLFRAIIQAVAVEDACSPSRTAFVDILLVTVADRAYSHMNAMGLLALSLKHHSWRSVLGIVENIVSVRPADHEEEIMPGEIREGGSGVRKTLIQYASQLVRQTLDDISAECFAVSGRGQGPSKDLVIASDRLDECYEKISAQKIIETCFSPSCVGLRYNNSDLILSAASYSSDFVIRKSGSPIPYLDDGTEMSLFSAVCIGMLRAALSNKPSRGVSIEVEPVPNREILSWAMLNNIAQNNASVLSKEDSDLFAVVTLAISPCAGGSTKNDRIAESLFDSTGGKLPEDKIKALVEVTKKASKIASNRASPLHSTVVVELNEACSFVCSNVVSALNDAHLYLLNCDPSGENFKPGLQVGPSQSILPMVEASLPLLGMPLNSSPRVACVKRLPKEKWVPVFVDAFVGKMETARNCNNPEWWDASSIREYALCLRSRPARQTEIFLRNLRNIEGWVKGVSLMFEQAARKIDIDEKVAVCRPLKGAARKISRRAL